MWGFLLAMTIGAALWVVVCEVFKTRRARLALFAATLALLGAVQLVDEQRAKHQTPARREAEAEGQREAYE